MICWHCIKSTNAICNRCRRQHAECVRAIIDDIFLILPNEMTTNVARRNWGKISRKETTKREKERNRCNYFIIFSVLLRTSSLEFNAIIYFCLIEIAIFISCEWHSCILKHETIFLFVQTDSFAEPFIFIFRSCFFYFLFFRVNQILRSAKRERRQQKLLVVFIKFNQLLNNNLFVSSFDFLPNLHEISLFGKCRSRYS